MFFEFFLCTEIFFTCIHAARIIFKTTFGNKKQVQASLVQRGTSTTRLRYNANEKKKTVTTSSYSILNLYGSIKAKHYFFHNKSFR